MNFIWILITIALTIIGMVSITRGRVRRLEKEDKKFRRFIRRIDKILSDIQVESKTS